MTVNQNFNGDIRALQIVHLGLTMGVFFFSLVMLGLWYTDLLDIHPLAGKDVMVGTCALFFILMTACSRFLFNKRQARVQAEPLKTKMSEYRMACIMRAAFLESAAFLALIMFMLNGYLELMVFPGLIVVYMLVLFPTRKRIIRELRPEYSEMQALEKTPF